MVTSETSFIANFTLEHGLAQSELNFCTYSPIRCICAAGHPGVYRFKTSWEVVSAFAPKYLIGSWGGSYEYHWLRFKPRGKFLTTWQKYLWMQSWPHLHCFVVQVCFPGGCSCCVGDFGWCVFWANVDIFPALLILFLRRYEQNSVLSFSVHFLLWWFSAYSFAVLAFWGMHLLCVAVRWR